MDFILGKIEVVYSTQPGEVACQLQKRLEGLVPSLHLRVSSSKHLFKSFFACGALDAQMAEMVGIFEGLGLVQSPTSKVQGPLDWVDPGA